MITNLKGLLPTTSLVAGMMRTRYAVALILFVLITISPIVVKLATGELGFRAHSSGLETISSATATMTRSSLGTLLVGCGESHTGADYLIVCPAKAYVINPESIIHVNVTVRFAHPQPCPHSSWEIKVSSLNNVKIVGETHTKLINAYTAIKTYDVRILGNGSLTITYYYGSGCPYGTKEVVKVLFFLVRKLPEKPSTEQQVLSITTSATPTQSTHNLTGKLTEVNVVDKYIVVKNYRIYIKGLWTCASREIRWRDLLNDLNKNLGSIISVTVLNENGELTAIKIVSGNVTCVRGGEGD